MVEISYHQKQAIRISTENESFSEKMRGTSILFVDDEYVNFLFFSELLANTGVAFFTAYTLSQASKYLEMDNISLVVISSSLASRTNFEVIRSIKIEYPNLPIITIIDGRDNDIEKACIEAGSDLYLSRYIDKNNLIEAIVELQHGV